MADFTSVPTVELLTRAADAAGEAADAATAELESVASLWERFAATVGVSRYRRCAARLLAASGPDHWRAVEATLRDVLAIHQADNQADDCVHCWEPGWLCATLEALRPLAEQVLQHLGDTA